MKRAKQKTIGYGREWTPDGTRERYRFVENASRGLRVTGPAHEFLPRLGHTGWYLDPWGDCGRDGFDLAVGYVLQLPSRDGYAQYVPAILDDCNPDCFIVDFHDVHDDKKEAARDADRMAELYAERERDYRTKDAAEQRALELREQIAAQRAIHSDLARERRIWAAWKNTAAPAICDAMQRQLQAARAEVRAAVAEIRRLTESPFSILEK